jgi:hypothetical protein
MGETKEIRDFIMKMKIGFRVIANSNETNSRKSSGEGMRKKRLRKGLPRKGKQTLFVNYIDEKNIVSKSEKE